MSMGRELRVLPGRLPGLVGGAIFLTIGGLLLLLLGAVAADGSEGNDLIVLGILASTCLVPGALLILRRRTARLRGLVVRVFEGGIARESASERRAVAFADVEGIDEHYDDGAYAFTLRARGQAPLVVSKRELDDVDKSAFELAVALLRGGPLSIAQARASLPAACVAKAEFVAPEKVEDDFYGAPILGEGALEFRPDGIRFQGRARRDIVPIVGGVLVSVVALVAIGVVFSALDLEMTRSSGKFGAFLAIVFGLAPGLGVHGWLSARARGQALDVLVPWSAVGVRTMTGGRALVRLTSPEFRGDVGIVARDEASMQAVAYALSPRVA